MDNLLQQGIVAAKAGDKYLAFDLLTRASQIPETSEQAWLWLSSVVDHDSERLFCLNNVLRVNTDNLAAQRGATMLKQKGIFPAMPDFPEPERGASIRGVNPAAPTWSQTVPASSEVFEPQPQSSYESDRKKQEVASLFQYTLMELSNNKSGKAVEKLLVGQGASPEIAKTVIQDAQYLIRKEHSAKYKKRMTRGFMWLIVGIVLTCGTYAFSNALGGKYVLFYGAIAIGFIDFTLGLIGWLFNG